jgi:serine/threonine protein kinase
MDTATFFPDDPRPDDPERLPGYVILGEIGAGGLSVVYRARQLSLNRVVAIRTTRGHEADRYLRREADILARVRHPHVVPVIDLLEHAGRVYLVLEHAEGGNLATRIADQPQEPRAAAALVERLARTLAHVHRCGVIHCNLKPRNVLLAAPPTGPKEAADPADGEEVYGIPLLCGFGLALDAQRRAEVEEGLIMGTPAYMAPEQASGRFRDIGPATDVYGLGACLYELLTGRRLFRSESVVDLLNLVLTREPEPVRRLNPAVDSRLEAICTKCLQKDPARRYAAAGELAADLRSFQSASTRRRWF